VCYRTFLPEISKMSWVFNKTTVKDTLSYPVKEASGKKNLIFSRTSLKVSVAQIMPQKGGRIG
jgi:hypothetical protein